MLLTTLPRDHDISNDRNPSMASPINPFCSLCVHRRTLYQFRCRQKPTPTTPLYGQRSLDTRSNKGYISERSTKLYILSSRLSSYYHSSEPKHHYSQPPCLKATPPAPALKSPALPRRNSPNSPSKPPKRNSQSPEPPRRSRTPSAKPPSKPPGGSDSSRMCTCTPGVRRTAALKPRVS